MRLRVTLDLKLVIQDIDAASDSHPFRACTAGPAPMQHLIGLQIGGGFMREVRERVGVTNGCTHLIEMMSYVATTAFQTMNPTWEEVALAKPVREKPHYLDTCVALRGDGEVIRRRQNCLPGCVSTTICPSRRVMIPCMFCDRAADAGGGATLPA